MGEKEDYLTSYRVFFENFAATVNPEDQLPVNIAGYTITESELPGEVLYWITQYLTEKQCPLTLMTPLRRIILDEVRVASKKYPNDFGYKSDESVYIALRLMQAVTARVNDVCLRYLDNSRLDTLPPPPPLDQRDLKTVSCATKNSRRVMEDRHVEIGNLEALFGIETTEPTSFYAVYDGHAGSAAATYCAAHLHQYLVESPHFTTDLRRAMRDSFLRTDAEFIRKSNQERACGGSTAVAVAIRGRKLLAAWAGDSLALLAKRMRLMQLVCPHKPSREDERDRIESSGGTVMYWGTWRVNGQLAVSRAIGDAQYKPYVTARPEIATVDLDGDEDFVVVACDGLWDFVSEDDVALAVYTQLAADPDDLKAVTKRLVVQAKRQGSADNISIIVVFLKDPRDIVADNRPPMDLGLDNALANAPPCAGETDACRRQADATAAAAGVDADAEAADNGVDHSDSDSEDLGPETAVDADDIEAEKPQDHEPAPPTPPAHAVEASHVDGALVDNVAESGDESEDEWNYFKGEGEREELNPSEAPDEPPRSDTPCQDNSAWETSSVDMNSSPLNPDAPVFVPTVGAGADVLLAESPRKPLPMDDIELPEEAQFETEAVVRPAELLDLDNCDQLNGHHNVSIDGVKEHLNGNDKCNMDSLGFGFNVGIEADKVKDSSIIQDFERIQKDTTDFCDIQVFQSHAETNPFAVEGNEELFERLKNKERDPMSMSFYQEKDDDTCERLARSEPQVDLNAVQTLPDSDDDDDQPNGLSDNEKENISPDRHTDPFAAGDNPEPNNDIMKFEDMLNLPQNIVNFGQGDNYMDYNVTGSDNLQFPNIEFESSNIPPSTLLQTDTPESHKLLFEQIPEIPDGKSSELGFTNDDVQDPSEGEKDARASPHDETSHDIEMESKLEDSPCEELEPDFTQTGSNDHVESDRLISPELAHLDDKENEIVPESDSLVDALREPSQEKSPISPALWEKEAITPEPSHDQENISVDIHQSENEAGQLIHNEMVEEEIVKSDSGLDAPEIKFDNEHVMDETTLAADETTAASAPLPVQSPLPSEASAPAESLFPSESPVPQEAIPSPSPEPPKTLEACESPRPADSPLPREPSLPRESPRPAESPLPREPSLPRESPMHAESPLPREPSLPRESPRPAESPLPRETSLSRESLRPAESPHPREPSLPRESPLQIEAQRETPQPTDASLPRDSPLPTDASLPRDSPLPTDGSLPRDSPLPIPSESLPSEWPLITETLAPMESLPQSQSPQPTEAFPTEVQFKDPEADVPEALAAADAAPAPSPLPADVPLPGESPAPPAEPRAPTPHAASEPEARADRAPADVQETPLSSEPEKSIEPVVEPPATMAEETPLAAPEKREPTPAPAPAPDLVPEQRAELVTDVDVGVPESRAQEICVPVTCEIGAEDGEQPGATPPPTPAVEPLAAAPLAAAATAAAAVAATAALAAAKPKTPAKKSPSTPTAKSASKQTTAPRTPSSATKRPAAAPAARTPASAPRAAPARTSSTTKPAAPRPAATTKAAATTKTAPAPRAPATKPATAAKLPSARPAAPSRPAITRSAPAARAPAPKAPAPARPATAKPAPAAPAARPAPRPATARPAPAAKPPTAAAKKPLERKPLTNGDVKETKPAAPRPPPITRPAPRAAPRTTPAPAAPRTAAPAPRPATRAPLDKQSKDLANRRITAKAAPPRTAPAKAPVGIKSTATKVGPKKSIESPKKEVPQTNGLSNGAASPHKAPPSPPALAADNALLPDVIA